MYDQPRGVPCITPPVATELSLPLSPSWLVVHHFFAGLMTVSFGSTIPASWQARRPSAAYWLLELSPVGGPSFIFLTGILLRTFGFSFEVETLKSRAFASFGLLPDATSFAGGGTSFT